MQIIENDKLLIQVNERGAELSSIFDKENRTEHLWQADPEIWGRHAPVLFPIVGQLEDGVYEINNQTFKLSQHGFARDLNFKLVDTYDNSLIYELKSSGDTLTVYPYDFKLSIVYTLHKNEIEVRYRVENTDTTDIHFSIGAHPGFTCPFNENEDFSDYYLEFEKEENLDRLLFNNGLLTGEKQKDYLVEDKKISLNRSTFNNDALIFQNTQSESISLKSKNHNRSLTLQYKGFPYLGIWSKPNANGNFVCIEPWFGITDTKGADLPFEKKKGRLSLKPEERFECSFSIIID